MDNRLHNLNKKISKSTIEMQRLISQIISPQKLQQLAPRHRHSMRQAQLQPLNPEQPQNYQNRRQMNEMYGMKNSNIETNSSTKFQESKDRFYSSHKNTTSNQNQGWKTNYSHKLQKGRDQVGKDTKFAIGNQLYPANRHILEEISRVRNTSRVIANKQQVYKSPSSKKLAQLDHNSVLQYAMTRPPLTQSSKPQQIFDYFYEFAPYFWKPLIKKFKNCFYFGESLDSSANPKYKSKYNGFLYFFNMKIYYGGFQDQYKHGYGVQINLKSGITYKGNFIKGHKVGKFLVFSENMLYEGYLEKGKYHGNGRLQTPISIYIGEFSNGMRNGEGQQYFFKSGLKLKGIFEMDKFCNKTQQQIVSPSSNRKSSKNQDAYKLASKQKKFPKINNIFEFSFHDSSEEQPDINHRKSQIKWTLKKIQPTRNLLKRKQYQQSCDMQQASEDDPLPAPFRRMAYSK